MQAALRSAGQPDALGRCEVGVGDDVGVGRRTDAVGRDGAEFAGVGEQVAPRRAAHRAPDQARPGTLARVDHAGGPTALTPRNRWSNHSASSIASAPGSTVEGTPGPAEIDRVLADADPSR